jgi:hypothetical protein
MAMGLAELFGMNPAELMLTLVLILLNLLLGLGFAMPLGRHLRHLAGPPVKPRRYVLELLGLYVIESLGLTFCMGIPVMGVGLAVVWGIILGNWLRTRTSHAQARRTAELVALYSCLPTISFLVIPAVAWAFGRSILSVTDGRNLGIPGFLPWPLTTILGFYAIPAIVASILKIAITTGEAGMLVRLHEKRALSGM